MTCNQTLSGLVKDCNPSQGGVKSVALALFDDVTEITIADGKVATIVMAESAKFKRYNFAKGSASMTSTKTIDRANGVQYVTTDLVTKYSRMETTKRTEMEALSVNDLRGLVEDNNGVWWLLGYDEPMNASAADGTTGAARTDSNAYNLTLQDVSALYPYEVPAELALSLIG